MKIINILSVLVTFIMLSSIGSATEIRGTVSDGTSMPIVWDAQNFAGFYYDIDAGLSSENLTIVKINGRSIPENGLVYQTTKIPIAFSYSKDKNLPVIKNQRTYDLVGWQAEKWVALNGQPNKLVKLIVEFEGSEKATLSGGGTLTLGNGYVIKINSVDSNAAPRQAWLSIMKNGIVVDDAIVQQDKLYNYIKDVGGEDETLVLSLYVSSIFSGMETDMIQLKYIWLIDESTLTVIDGGDKFGVFEVFSTDPITLKNTASISLTANSIVTLMGNMKFRTADNSSVLRFYPMVNTEGTIITDLLSRLNKCSANVTVNSTVVPTPIVVEKIVEKIIYVNVTTTPALTVVPTPIVKNDAHATKWPAEVRVFALLLIVSLLVYICTLAYLHIKDKKK